MLNKWSSIKYIQTFKPIMTVKSQPITYKNDN